MARIRTVKPEFFTHDGLFDLELSSKLPVRISFAGLWCHADREGRFEWKPKQLKLGILPYDHVDFSQVLEVLASGGFIEKYEVDGREYGVIPTFNHHQHIHDRGVHYSLFIDGKNTAQRRLPFCEQVKLWPENTQHTPHYSVCTFLYF